MKGEHDYREPHAPTAMQAIATKTVDYVDQYIIIVQF